MAPATSRWSRSLLVSQVAVSVVILISIMPLLARSLYLLQQVETGVKTDNLIDVDTFPLAGETEREGTGTHYRRADRAA